MSTTALAPQETALHEAEYREELDRWLRRRFRWLCSAAMAVGTAALIFAVLGSPLSGAGRFIDLLARSVQLAIILLWLFRLDHLPGGRADLLRAASRMLLFAGLASLLADFALSFAGAADPVAMAVSIMLWHLAACLFLPWTPRESLRPFVPLLVIWAILSLVQIDDAPWAWRIVRVFAAPGILLPGLAVCGWRLERHRGRFNARVIRRSFDHLRGEFIRARTIHEAMFPQSVGEGPIRFHFAYAPMLEIGGDYVNLFAADADDPSAPRTLVMIDVTGHGLTAALTVNRLHGELERIFAENPRAAPGAVLALLNRYFALTLARHQIYATGLCARIEPARGMLDLASAGHPPIFIRSRLGAVREAGATTVPLGVLGADDFDPAPVEIPLEEGDAVLAFTDGAFEARDELGRVLGLTRLRQWLTHEPAPSDWSTFLADAVARHRGPRAEDDVLIAELRLAAHAAGAGEEPRTTHEVAA